MKERSKAVMGFPLSKTAPGEGAGRSLPVNGKRQQHVSRQPAPAAVSRGHVEHAAGYHWTRAVQGAAFRWSIINRGVFVRRIVVPNDLSISCRISPDVPVLRSREHHTRNGRHRGRLCWAAKQPPSTGGGRRRPDFFSCYDADGDQSSAHVWIKDPFLALFKRPLGEGYVRIGDVHIHAIGGGAPLNAAQRAAAAHAVGP